MSVSIKVIQLVWNARIGDPSQKLVLLALADRASDQGTCFPSVADIARRSELSERQVQRDLAALTGQKLIAIIKGGVRAGRNRPSRSPTYQLNLEMLAAIQQSQSAIGSASVSRPLPTDDAILSRPTVLVAPSTVAGRDTVSPEPSVEPSERLTTSGDTLTSPRESHPDPPPDEPPLSPEEQLKIIRSHQDLWRICGYGSGALDGLSRALASELGCDRGEAQRYLLEAKADA